MPIRENCVAETWLAHSHVSERRPPARRVFFVPDRRNTIASFPFAVGVITDNESIAFDPFPESGGVMGTECFSTKQLNGQQVLFLETKHVGLAEPEELHGRLTDWWLHPYWVPQWDFPARGRQFLVGMMR